MKSYRKLLSPLELSQLSFQNRVVMAPLTRSRATVDHIPTEIMNTYYGQRASAGLIITEGTATSINGVGYARIPGIYNDEQVEAWRPIAKAVKNKGAKFFMQLMHTGRISHPDNMPDNATILAPSAIVPKETKIYVDEKGELDIPAPEAMSLEQIQEVKKEFVIAAKNALKAGLDGVEVHSANGYLLDQFLNPETNRRTDSYGGSVENRCKLILEIVEEVIAAIGESRVGIRFSPNGAMNDIGPFKEQDETFSFLSKKMDELGVVYIHLVNHDSMGAPKLPETIRENMKANYKGLIILSGGYTATEADRDIRDGKGDLVAFGRDFIANPDLVDRFRKNAPLNEPDQATFYTPGPEGYIDYPVLEEAKV